MNNLINKLNKIYVRVGPSSIAGVGLIAIRNIPKNTVIMNYNPNNQKMFSIPFALLKEKGLPKSVIDMLKDYQAHDKNIIEIEDNFDPNYIHIVSYLNHSYHPNIYYDNETGNYIARQNIKKGAEILLNYLENDYCIDCIDFIAI